MTRDPSVLVKELVELVGRPGTSFLLRKAGINPSTAHKLSAGRYTKNIGYELLLKIEKAWSEVCSRRSAS